MSSSAKRVADHRARMRAQGLRPVQIWVRDTTAEGFVAETRAWMESLRDKIDEQALDEAMEAELASAEGWAWDEDR
jgi:hypothetical protein